MHAVMLDAKLRHWYCKISKEVQKNVSAKVDEGERFREIGSHSSPRAFRRSRSFTVTDFGTNRKLIYDFLLVINTNLPPILHRFGVITFHMSKIAIFRYHSFSTFS